MSAATMLNDGTTALVRELHAILEENSEFNLEFGQRLRVRHRLVELFPDSARERIGVLAYSVVACMKWDWLLLEPREEPAVVDDLLALLKDRILYQKGAAERWRNQSIDLLGRFEWAEDDVCARTQLENDFPYPGIRAPRAAFAACEEFFDESWRAKSIRDYALDADRDQYSIDTHGLAAQDVAGPMRDPRSNPELRHRFWRWWIDEALCSVLDDNLSSVLVLLESTPT